MGMEHRCIKAGHKKSLNIFSNDVRERDALEYFKSGSSSVSSSSCPQCQLTLSIIKYHKSLRSSSSRISKRISSYDLQYLSHYLELIQIRAAKAATSNISVAWSPSNARCSTETVASPGNVSIVGSLPASSVDVVLSPLNTWISGSETRSKNMINITRRPLFRLGTAIDDINCIKGSLESYHYGSPGGLPDPYSSSILSTSSELSSCASTIVSHGVLQCTWSNGVPYFMFSTENKPHIYLARPLKSAKSDQDSVDWTYLIHLRIDNMKNSDLVGRMNVSARYRNCANNMKIIETESVLYGNHKTQEAEQAYSSPGVGKHRKSPRKVSKFLKPRPSPKHRPNTKMWETSTSTELSMSQPGQDEDEGDFDDTECLNLLEDDIASNFELAAIVVKEHIQTSQIENAEASGWGMSFLKRATEKQPTNGRSNTFETSMDVLIPAGHHGGPKTQSVGPSSLTERWRDRGQCDCGGWDIGCPITVLSSRPNKDCTKSFSLFLTGEDERGVPSMKMVNAQKGLYCIEFQPRLSALQCFSIAVAVIHSRCPTLRPQG